MPNVTASFSVMSSLLTEPITRGEVQPEGLSLEVHAPESIDKLSRDMLDLRFDIGEMSVATFLKAVEEGLPLIGLPLFTSGRRFLQPYFQLSRASGARDLSGLKGKTVGAPQYWMSTAVWQRLILRQMHGVAPEDVNWLTWQPERLASLRIPGGVNMRQDTSGRTPLELMQAGEIDASLNPFPSRDGAAAQDVATPAYQDRVASQRDFYRQTGIFPIMHLTVIERDLAEREPAIAGALCDAYQEAKELVQARTEPTNAPQPSAGETTREMVELMGSDPWPYGISRNQKVLQTLLDISAEQGLLGRAFTVEELFVPSLPEAYR